jgi:hypothetical protein
MPIILVTYLLHHSVLTKSVSKIFWSVSRVRDSQRPPPMQQQRRTNPVATKIEIPARRHKNWNPVLTKEFSSWMHQSPKHMLSQKQSTMPSSTETIPSIPCSLADYTETIKIPSPSVFMLHIKPARHWAFRSQLRISLPKDATKLPIKENHNYASEASDE